MTKFSTVTLVTYDDKLSSSGFLQLLDDKILCYGSLYVIDKILGILSLDTEQGQDFQH